jgi:hypothetical protein
VAARLAADQPDRRYGRPIQASKRFRVSILKPLGGIRRAGENLRGTACAVSALIRLTKRNENVKIRLQNIISVSRLARQNSNISPSIFMCKRRVIVAEFPVQGVHQL